MYRLENLHLLPKVRDCSTMLYVEHAIIERAGWALQLCDAEGTTTIPSASLLLVLLGPGTSLTHEAAKVLAEQACVVAWTGEHGVRLYASGVSAARSSAHLLHQAKMWADLNARMHVVRNLYALRFGGTLDRELTLQQIRGMEGLRVRKAYAEAAQAAGLAWQGRSYQRDKWDSTDPVNRALSVANSCLYGLCHAAVLAAGYDPPIGFVHTGTMLAFVYDVADLYKTETSIPVAFQIVAEGTADLERNVRIRMRDMFFDTQLLKRIVPDLHRVLEVPPSLLEESDEASGDHAELALWDPEHDNVPGGTLYLPPDATSQQEGEHDQPQGGDKEADSGCSDT
jgi:CRISPR-associated protein Cas1